MSPTWNLILIVFNLSPIQITRKFSSILVFRMSISDNVSLPHWPYSIANNESNLLEISIFGNFGIKLKYLATAPASLVNYRFGKKGLLLNKQLSCTSIPRVLTCIMSFNCGKWKEHISGTTKNHITWISFPKYMSRFKK